jgi:hypothetical protein
LLAKKSAFFLKHQCYGQSFAKTSSSLSKKTPFFGENILKNHKTSFPDSVEA